MSCASLAQASERTYIQAIGYTKWLLSIIESNGMINETISLF